MRCAGKYKRHCVKVQVVIDNRGTPMWFSGPHIGSSADNALWRDYNPWLTHEFDNELLLADKAYINAFKCLTSVKRQPGVCAAFDCTVIILHYIAIELPSRV